MPLSIELPAHAAQTAFNLRRWDEVLRDPHLARFEGRVETDRHGKIVMSPPPGAFHSRLQSEIHALLRTLMAGGKALVECPVSTADGVRAPNVIWASERMLAELGRLECFPAAPEICVEVLSPANTKAELAEKMALYFDAGAEEVWFCSREGCMSFYADATGRIMRRSKLCPKFPTQIEVG